MSTDLGCSRGEKGFSWEGDVWAWLKMACASVSLLGPLDLNIFRRFNSHAQKRMRGKLKKKDKLRQEACKVAVQFPSRSNHRYGKEPDRTPLPALWSTVSSLHDKYCSFCHANHPKRI